MSVRLLTSRSPALPLGVWLAAGAAGGSLLSGMATALALRQRGLRRSDRWDETAAAAAEPWFAPAWPGRRASSAAEPESESDRPFQSSSVVGNWHQAGPERGPGEPPPTVSVPFRVLRRAPRTASATQGWPASAQPAAADPKRSGATVARDAQGADDWDNGTEEDDW